MLTSVHQLPRFGTRIVLRRLTVADLADFQAYRLDEQIGLYQGWKPLSDSDATRFLAHMSSATPLQPGQWLQIGIADMQTNQLIGDIGMCVTDDLCEALIGFSLRARRRGRDWQLRRFA